MQSLYCITKVVKYLHEQTEQALDFFKENKKGEIDLSHGVGEQRKIKEGISDTQVAGPDAKPAAAESLVLGDVPM